MSARSTGSLRALVGAAGVFCFAVVVATSEPSENKKAVDSQPNDGGNGITVAEARERAKLMHHIYAATLDVLHHHFFRRDRSVLPARAMEDVFAEMDQQSHIKAGWIAVNTKP